ncbi:BTAD domain-containing putative transcriptional regulator [Nonomuraea sp. NPDC048882]|uniref:BTAD domain-containing putative transcriptional regulator n=1 Tax=Nonomuraea sp. NPDC048882 TaxID=3154347 RepID=UPI0033F103AF
MVRLRVLGQVRAEVAGHPVDLGTPLQRAVVVRLVCAGGHVVSTDRFLDDLWRGQPPPKALSGLQAYVSHLRRVLEPGRAPRTPARVLVSAPPGYLLRLDADQVDAWRFPRLVESAAARLSAGEPADALERLDEATELWTGRAYGEFADEEWALPQAAQLEELRLVAAEYRAEAVLALGRPAEAVPALERHVGAHPLRENAVRLLALAHYRSGRQAQALDAIRRTRALLAQELGVDPGPELRTLESDILAHRETLHAVPPPPPAQRTLPDGLPETPPHDLPATPATGPIGRAAELARLQNAAEQARAGFRLARLDGEAGAGKSTLAEALRRDLAGAGWRTAVGRCPETEGGAPPAWAWSEILRHLSAGHPPAPAVAARLAPLLAGDAAPVGQFRLAQAVGDYLEDMPGPLLITLEDAHRADEETLQLLRHLAARLAHTPVLVLMTYRTNEVTGDLIATGAALTVCTAENLTLGGLARDDVARLLRERSGLEMDADTVATIALRTGGNPLFVSETARLVAAEGPVAVHRLPPGIRDLIRLRVARLPATAQTTLRNAAVVGRQADTDVLIAMTDADEDTVLDGLEAGVLSGLLSEPSPGTVRFTHVLVRQALYEDIPRLRRTRLHGRVLSALQDVREGDVAALAHHALAAATTATAERAAEYAIRAADRASALYAHREAATLLTRALEALGPAADRPVLLDLLCRLVSAQAHYGDVAAALATRARALGVARRMGDDLAVARAVTSYDAPLIWTIQRDMGVDHDVVEAVRRTMPAEPGELRCRLLITLAAEIEADDLELVEDAGTEAVRIARELGDARLLCMAFNARYWVLLRPVRREELERVASELLEVSEAAGLLGYQALGHFMLLMVALGRNDWAGARRHAARAVERSTSGQLGLTLTILSILDAVRLLVEGHFERAEQAYTALAEQMEQGGGSHADALGVLGRFCARIACGRAQESVAELAAMRGRYDGGLDEPYVRALLAAGRLDEARAAWRDRPPLEGSHWEIMLVLRAENAIRLGERGAAAECYRSLLPVHGEMAGLHTGSMTLGPVDHTLGELAAFLGDPGAAAAHFEAAAEVARRVGSPHWARLARERAERHRAERQQAEPKTAR